MFSFMILVPMIVLIIAGYLIMVTAEQVEDPRIKAFDKYLSLWVFVLSGLLVVFAAIAPAMGDSDFGPSLPKGGRIRPPDFPPFAREKLIRERPLLEPLGSFSTAKVMD